MAELLSCLLHPKSLPLLHKQASNPTVKTNLHTAQANEALCLQTDHVEMLITRPSHEWECEFTIVRN